MRIWKIYLGKEIVCGVLYSNSLPNKGNFVGSIKKVSTIPVIFNPLGYFQSKHTFSILFYIVLAKISLIDLHSYAYLT